MYLPLLVDVSRMRILVVGGGDVGTRRARMFWEAGARVRVYSLEFSKELEELARRGVDLVRGDIESDDLDPHIDWADIVVIAVDGEASSRIAGKAISRGKLVNNAVKAEDGNLIVPFRASVKGLIIAVTSLGASGLAARRALEKIVDMIRNDVEIETLYASHSRVKRLLREEIDDPRARMAIHGALWSDEEYRKYCRIGDIDKAMERALDLIESYKHEKTRGCFVNNNKGSF